ncbi:Sodium/calcium exchanger protein-domain-containing protein [Suillus subalutaceus]|uniref:Sodium/calcium exchanger protein-domain-containing protein n=1 Tax=Suillus subalutaceus TaxID=48586 RepID=UPI001B87DA4B|nr:Sodium/calcium exchanger protein-domain-containing protein [Suillus subalutaceus]KAG1854463.1 Sodium/calcium exchanger protein-domain-containing protein [Suillus subalutaceus]
MAFVPILPVASDHGVLSIRVESISTRHTSLDEPVSQQQSTIGLRRRKGTGGVRHREPNLLLRAATSMLTPEKPIAKPSRDWRSIRAIILSSWFNVLLVFIPISWSINFALPDQHTLIFVLTFLAIIPLAKLLAYATDEFSIWIGQTLAGILNATLETFFRSVELIVSVRSDHSTLSTESFSAVNEPILSQLPVASDHSSLSTESFSAVNEPIPSQLPVASDHSALSTESISAVDVLIPSQLCTTTLRRRKSTSDICHREPNFLRRAATLMLTPEKPIAKPPSTWKSIRAMILSSWFNVLLVFIPISWAIHFALPDQHTLIFVLSFLAIIPLDKLRAYATDDLSIRVGQTLAGLLNATLENVVELIVSIIALTKCELGIVQSSFLVLGMCFFAGGMRFSEQGFGLNAMQVNSSLLTISAIAILLPGAFHMALQGHPLYSELSTNYNILRISHGVAIILLSIYGSYLVFQLFSHRALYNADIQKTKGYEGHNPWLQLRLYRRKTAKPILSPEPMGDEEAATDPTGFASTEDTDSEVETYMSVPVALGLLVVVTTLIAVTAEFLVDSIDDLTESRTIGKEFIAVILLPIVGNAAEHVTSVTVSFKGNITLSLGVAVGSSIQIALFVIPFIVTLAWIMGKPLTFLFDPLESIVLFVSVLTVNYVVQDGKSNWLEGMILVGLYLILAVTFGFILALQASSRAVRKDDRLAVLSAMDHDHACTLAIRKLTVD